ncbi:MAG: class I SAM-dependent methyltransferase [Bacillota bacterium]
MVNPKTILFDIPGILNKIAIEEGQTVGELGCGNFGYFVFPVARLVGARGKLYAVDILKSTLEEIKKKAVTENLKQIETIWTNLEVFKGAKIESSSLDRALLINTLHQSQKRAEILRESVRLLKSGGRLLVVEWKNGESPLGPPTEKRVSRDALKQAGPRLGLILKDEFDAGPFHYGLIFHKS